MALQFKPIISFDYKLLGTTRTPPSTNSGTLLPSRPVSDRSPIFCGQCGTPNPSESQFCRKCGHRLSDDIVVLDEPDDEAPVSPVDGIDIDRYPLVDPESGEEILPEPSPERSAPDRSERPIRRGSIILWSLGIHFVIVSIVGMTALALMAQLSTTLEPGNLQDLLTRSEDVRQRFESNQLDRDQAQIEERQILESHGIMRLFLLLSIPVLIGFFISGLVAGRLWRPRQLLDVGLSGLLLGGLCSLCLFSPLVWPLAFALSLLGALAGRRWR